MKAIPLIRPLEEGLHATIGQHVGMDGFVTIVKSDITIHHFGTLIYKRTCCSAGPPVHEQHPTPACPPHKEVRRHISRLVSHGLKRAKHTQGIAARTAYVGGVPCRKCITTPYPTHEFNALHRLLFPHPPQQKKNAGEKPPALESGVSHHCVYATFS